MKNLNLNQIIEKQNLPFALKVDVIDAFECQPYLINIAIDDDKKPSFNKKISFFFNQDGKIKSSWFGNERLPNFDLDKDLPCFLKRLCEAYSQFKQVEKPEGAIDITHVFYGCV